MGSYDFSRIYSMEAFFDDNRRYITVSSGFYEYDNDKKCYIYKIRNALSRKVTGSLLVSYVNSNFFSFESFSDFFINDGWGITGLIGIAKRLNLLKYDAFFKNEISEHEYIELLKSLFADCEIFLSESRSYFERILNICINNANKKHLKELKPAQRLYIEKKFHLLGFPDQKYFSDIKEAFDLISNIQSENVFEDLKIGEAETARRMKSSFNPVKHFYYSQDITNLCMIELLNVLDDFPIKKCPNCESFFIPENRSDEKYCGRVFNGKTCSEWGWLKKSKSDVLYSSYRKQYQNYNGQKESKSQGKSKNTQVMFEQAFKAWAKVAKEKYEQAKAGKIMIEEFNEFLKEPWFLTKKESDVGGQY